MQFKEGNFDLLNTNLNNERVQLFSKNINDSLQINLKDDKYVELDEK